MYRENVNPVVLGRIGRKEICIAIHKGREIMRSAELVFFISFVLLRNQQAHLPRLQMRVAQSYFFLPPQASSPRRGLNPLTFAESSSVLEKDFLVLFWYPPFDDQIIGISLAAVSNHHGVMSGRHYSHCRSPTVAHRRSMFLGRDACGVP